MRKGNKYRSSCAILHCNTNWTSNKDCENRNRDLKSLILDQEKTIDYKNIQHEKLENYLNGTKIAPPDNTPVNDIFSPSSNLCKASNFFKHLSKIKTFTQSNTSESRQSHISIKKNTKKSIDLSTMIDRKKKESKRKSGEKKNGWKNQSGSNNTSLKKKTRISHN